MIRNATVKRYCDDSHDPLRANPADVLTAYDFARRLKTPSGLSLHAYICTVWTSGPDGPHRKVSS